MLETLIGGAAAILSGGATGLIGVLLQRAADAYNKAQDLKAAKQKMDHEIELKKADAEIMREEWAQRTRVAEVTAAGNEAVADAQAFSASLTSEPQRYSDPAKAGPVSTFFLVLLDFVRGIVRPGLTLYLCWIATQMYVESRATLASIGALGSSQAPALVGVHAQIVNTLLYLFTTCVLWWFGTRNKQAQPKAG